MPQKWTMESCREIALQYSRRADWSNGHQASYAAAKRNGWFEQCVAHISDGNKQWTKDECVAAAADYKNRNAFKRGNPSAYSAALYNKWVEDCCGHMEYMHTHRSLEHCKRDALKYLTMNRWKKGPDRNSYFVARRNEWLEACCGHMEDFVQITMDDCLDAGALYSSRSEWKFRDLRTYSAACINGWIDFCCDHMEALTGPSVQEMQVFEYVKSLCPDAVQSSRKLLGNRQEIDIYIPSLKIGIEFNGLFWHNEKLDVPVDYHQRKTDAAKSVGIRLVHIWSDEWSNRPKVVKGYLRQLLGAEHRRINARDCVVSETTGSECRAFLDENHIQGFKGGSGVSLSYQGEIVAAAIVSKNPKGEMELARWCVKMDTRVVGGFQKVLSRLPENLVSFCDTAKHTGEGYLKAGWIQIGRAQLTIWLTDGKVRKSRMHFKKQDLAKLGAVGETEKEMAESIGFYRIGGCEQLKFQWLPKHLQSQTS